MYANGRSRSKQFSSFDLSTIVLTVNFLASFSQFVVHATTTANNNIWTQVPVVILSQIYEVFNETAKRNEITERDIQQGLIRTISAVFPFGGGRD